MESDIEGLNLYQQALLQNSAIQRKRGKSSRRLLTSMDIDRRSTVSKKTTQSSFSRALMSQKLSQRGHSLVIASIHGGGSSINSKILRRVRRNPNEEAQFQELVDLITDSRDKKPSYWSDIASIICCERSDVYLRSLVSKVRSFFQTTQNLQVQKKRTKSRATQKKRRQAAPGITSSN